MVAAWIEQQNWGPGSSIREGAGTCRGGDEGHGAASSESRCEIQEEHLDTFFMLLGSEHGL